jgi:2-methylcitrate dehydratase
MAGDEEKWHPKTRETADHSIPYVVACAVARGDVTIADFSPESLTDPEIRRLLDNLTVVQDDECEAAWPDACLNKVTLVRRGGDRCSATVRYYRGHARNPMTHDELQEKFSRQVAPTLGPDGAERLAGVIWNLGKEQNVKELFEAAEVS